MGDHNGTAGMTPDEWVSVRFWLLLRRSGTPANQERYEFEQFWRTLDTKLEDQLGAYPVPVALSGRSRRIALAPQTPR